MAETLLSYGESGTFKSSQAREFAEYQCSRCGGDENPDIHVRLISGDSTWKPMNPAVGKGKIKPVSIKASHPQKLAIINALSEGYWPNVINEYGIADWTKGMTLGFDNLAGIIWEGLTEVAGGMQDHLIETRRNTGQEIHSTFEQKLEGVNKAFRYGGAPLSSYNFIQAETKKYVKALAALPIDRVFITAHEGKGQDTQKRLIFGPAIIGTAANDKVSGWFGTTLHHESYMMEQSGGRSKVIDGQATKVPGVRAFFERHPDPDVPGIFWPAKLDCAAEQMAGVWKKYPGGYVPLQLDVKTGKCVSGIRQLLTLMDEEGEE